MTDAGEPAASAEIAAQWRSMGGGLEDAGIALQQAVIGSKAGWTGQAADAMRYRLGQVADWSLSTGKGFTAASSAVGEQSSVVGEAKTRMPEPVPYDPGQIFDEAMADGLFGIMTLSQRLHSQKQKHDAAYNEAVLVVTARDGQLAVGAATIPAFTAPPVLSDDGGGRPPDDHDRRPPGRGPGGGPDAVPGGGFGPGPGGAGPGQAGPPPASPVSASPGSTGAEAAAGGRGAGGARGGAGMGGMPMGGGRGQGDEDAEHQRPTWLQEDDPDALFGTDETTAPPVIGAD